MKKRTAKKILKLTNLHWFAYFNGVMYSMAPLNPVLYFKAHRTLGQKPYYDSSWLKRIYEYKKVYGVIELPDWN